MQNILKNLSIIIALAFIPYGLASYHINNFSVIDQDIQNNPNMHVGMMVLDPQSGATVYQYQAEQYFHPASNVKLFTAIAAMLSLGGNYQFTTNLYAMPHSIEATSLRGNLYIKFSGDPSLEAQDLHNLLVNLSQSGIKTINGNVILDDTIFPSALKPLGVVREDSMWGFGASASSITLHENSVAVSFKPNTARPEIASTTPDYVKVISNQVWENDKNIKLCSFRAEAKNAHEIILIGCLPKRLGTTINLAMPDVNAYAQYIVAQSLKSLGIHLKGKVIIGSMPKSASLLLATHHSANLAQLLNWTLRHSDNLYASAITKTLGLKLHQIGSDKAGSVAITEILAPYQLPNYILEDGNGDSTYDLVPPQTFTLLLYHAYQNPMLKDFLMAALPQVNVNGTLADFPAGELKGKIIAKTGTMTYTSSLSGFITIKSGKVLIFSLLIDDTPLKNNELKVFEAKILSDLYNSEG